MAQLVAADFNPDAGTLRLRSRKGDGTEKVFHATLTTEGVEFFRAQTITKARDDIVFENRGRLNRAMALAQERMAARVAKGQPITRLKNDFDDDLMWRESEQTRPMIETCKRARLKPAIGFHGLRHTWASHAVMNGTPLLVVAKNLGHSDTRMVERHYGHLSPSYVQEAIRAGAPKFGFTTNSTVVAFTATKP